MTNIPDVEVAADAFILQTVQILDGRKHASHVTVDDFSRLMAALGEFITALGAQGDAIAESQRGVAQNQRDLAQVIRDMHTELGLD